MNESIEITAAADNGKSAKVAGVAYSGAKMRIFGWSLPIVVDVAGLNLPEEVPLLANHENHVMSRVGVAKPTIKDGHVSLDGEIVATNDLAENIVTQARAGAKWQLSIGAEVQAAERVVEGKRMINGQEHEAPFYHVTKATLREVSIVAVGADKNTSLAIAASLSLVGESIAEPLVAAAAENDWEQRYKGASKKINELQASLATAAEATTTLKSQLDEANQALAAANAECEQLKAKVDEGVKSLEAKESELAKVSDSLAKAESEVAHLKETRQLLTAGVLSAQTPTFDQRIEAARSPEEREAIRAEKLNARAK